MIKLIEYYSPGYHAGDLGKSESRWQIMSGNRSTGHFGTGTYFVGNKEEINIEPYNKRPQHEIDFDKYNLYKPFNKGQAEKLHQFLKDLNYNIKYYEIAKNSSSVIQQAQRKYSDLVYEYENALSRE